MITLDYRLSTEWVHRSPSANLQRSTEAVLRYDCFLGDVTFVVDGVDLSTRWGWVPMLDLAVSLHAIAAALPTTGDGLFEFTESEATLAFCLRDRSVVIDASYVPTRAHTGHGALVIATEGLLARILSDLTARYAGLADNPYVQEICAASGVLGGEI